VPSSLCTDFHCSPVTTADSRGSSERRLTPAATVSGPRSPRSARPSHPAATRPRP
jgi:hypothetical protein